MNIYARIRRIENQDEFKRLFNTLTALEYPSDFEPTKDWADFGVDGYVKSKNRVYAVYCPKYSERKTLKQYKDKIRSDFGKIISNLDSKKINFIVKEWVFVTPDDLTIEIQDFIKNLTEDKEMKWGTLTAQTLAPLFMKHKAIHIDFPEITAGLQYDKVPNFYIKFVQNRGYDMLEVFNNGTEAIQDLEISIMYNDKEWILKNDNFLYDFDDPFSARPHTSYTLKKGERQYLNNVPTGGNFYYKVSGNGIESGKTVVQEGLIESKK